MTPARDGMRRLDAPMTRAAIEELIPHRAPMLLLDTVESFDGERLECRATPRRGAPFVKDQRVPAMLSIEYFAQAAAVYCALTSPDDTPMRMGVLLGARQLELETDYFSVDEPLSISVRESWGGGSVAQFECELRRAGALVARAAINVKNMPAEADSAATESP